MGFCGNCWRLFGGFVGIFNLSFGYLERNLCEFCGDFCGDFVKIRR